MKRSLVIWTLFVICFYVAFATTTGPNYPGTRTDSAPGTAWTNLTNIGADDGSLATNGGLSTRTVKATNFGFSLASNQTIDSITVAIEARGGSAHISSTFQMLKASTATGDDNGSWLDPALVSTTLSVTTLSGGLWGTTWTYSDVNNSGFGVTFKFTDDGFGPGEIYEVDYVNITIYHHTVSSGRKRVIGMARNVVFQ